MVDVISRGEPATMLAHWTGIFWNGQELGFKIFQEVVRRLNAKFDNLLWMKLSEIARYAAARELTRVERNGNQIIFDAPFACPDFTLRFEMKENKPPRLRINNDSKPLNEVAGSLKLVSATWCRENDRMIACFGLPKGKSALELAAL